MNLLSQAEIDDANAAMKDLFDTFCRDLPVRFYKTPKEVIMVDPNYSSDFDGQNNLNLKTAQYQEFKCRVFYSERQPFDAILKGNDEQVRGEFFYNSIKIHMELDAFEYLKNTHRFIFDGQTYGFDSSFRGLGILGQINYYEIALKRVN